MSEAVKGLSEEDQEVLYHVGLNSLSLDEYLKLRDRGDIEGGGQNPTMETFLMLIKKGKRLLKEA